MAGELRTSVILDLVDRITSPLRRITQSFSGLGSRMGLDRLMASGKRVRESFKGVAESAKGLRDNLLWISGTAAAATWGVEKMVSGVADLGNEARISAERLGVSTRWLQEWMYVGKQFGVDNDALIDGFKELGLRADEFVKTGQGGAAESFQRLGISVKDLRKTAGETDKILDLVMSRMGKIENDAARQRIFDEVFGGTGGEQMVAMLGKSREELNKLIKAGHEGGAIFSDEEIEQSRIYTKQMGDLRTSLFAIQRTVVGALLPAINQWLGGVQELSKANREAISSEILGRIREFWQGLQEVWSWTSKAADMVNGFGNLIGIVAALMAGKFLFSVAVSAMAMAKFGKTVVMSSLSIGGQLVRALFLCSSALIGIAARAIPAAIMGIRAFSLALVTTPIGLIITAIAGLAAAVYLIYKNWSSIAKWFSGMWQSVLAFFDQGIGEIIKSLLEFSPAGLLLKAIDAVFEVFGLRPLSELGAEWIGGLWDGVKSKFEAFTGWLKSSVDAVTGWLPDWMTGGGLSARVSAPIASAPPTTSLGGPAMTGRPSPLALQGQKTDLGGELRIKIDSEGRARVESMKPKGGLGYRVESGPLGVIP
ncbi:phage tail tape measure protein [Pseudomonas sichuanensis]|uniref:hypothetical protein n=1 Tax=Pseudomonas extremaustralis TaxID=359110 RepID=UPI002307B393|nr:hypothetical protein [Pseudomonas extremaustralis]MDB1109707.1 hypothetical protein [Pseudomonas extremaustralis]